MATAEPRFFNIDYKHANIRAYVALLRASSIWFAAALAAAVTASLSSNCWEELGFLRRKAWAFKTNKPGPAAVTQVQICAWQWQLLPALVVWRCLHKHSHSRRLLIFICGPTWWRELRLASSTNFMQQSSSSPLWWSWLPLAVAINFNCVVDETGVSVTRELVISSYSGGA